MVGAFTHGVPIDKVIAYITRERRLLVFSQPDFPNAGIQVPGGSAESSESPQQAVLREARKETGLEGLAVRVHLGTNLYDSPDRRFLRQQYFQLVSRSPVPGQWDHWEESPNDGGASVLFRFWWADLARMPQLAAGRGALMSKLDCVG